MMFRASSEMAVAISVALPKENPSLVASARPFWRATTMSRSDLSATLHSASISVIHLRIGAEWSRRRFVVFANGTRKGSPLGGRGGRAPSLAEVAYVNCTGHYARSMKHLSPEEK